MNIELNVTDHNRDSAGLRYVYPVVSRRAGGVSVGINLNTNNACNWRCVYCQVPDLSIGTAPPVDLKLLEKELRGFLHELLRGDFMHQRVPEEARRINDIALSGNGEPTSSKEFAQVVTLIAKVKVELLLPEHIKLILITNGSLIHRPVVQQGLKILSENNGEIWFKLDRASSQGMQDVNHSKMSLDAVRQNLTTTAALCSTWLQTCWFSFDGQKPNKNDEDDYLKFLGELLSKNVSVKGVLLYSLVRPSLQPEAPHLSSLSLQEMEGFAERIRMLGITVKISL